MTQKKNYNVHSEEMHIAHADSKDNVAVDDITPWADRCTKCHENIISRFHFDSALLFIFIHHNR